MDTGEGRFEQFDSEAELRDKLDELRRQFPRMNEQAFSIGQEVEINGSKFRVSKITPKKMTLRILPR
jgi:uncharacterized Zn finger protein